MGGAKIKEYPLWGAPREGEKPQKPFLGTWIHEKRAKNAFFAIFRCFWSGNEKIRAFLFDFR